tara:strand:- start:1582 stop:1938 length:357 start_codon:yes stop_codon:yes gene_type:complete
MNDCNKLIKNKKLEKYAKSLSNEYTKELKFICKNNNTKKYYDNIRNSYEKGLIQTINHLCLSSSGRFKKKITMKHFEKMFKDQKKKKQIISKMKKTLKMLKKMKLICLPKNNKSKKKM